MPLLMSSVQSEYTLLLTALSVLGPIALTIRDLTESEKVLDQPRYIHEPIQTSILQPNQCTPSPTTSSYQLPRSLHPSSHPKITQQTKLAAFLSTKYSHPITIKNGIIT
ncbi:hypothetical protein GE09DRAFT_424906 [Coniochaeta sp. 2T2.1]|nr:hypothetical protein GE09DRAFT_424906 [Coniochaeta sp. 2T2.1]